MFYFRKVKRYNMKNAIDKELKEYIEKNIFPIYDKNEEDTEYNI